MAHFENFTRMKSLLFFLFSAAVFAQTPVRTVVGDGVSVDSYKFDGFRPLMERGDDAIYVLNFWATWCAPCVKELPAFEKLNAEYADKNVKVILVSLDFNTKVESALLPFIKRKNLESEVIHLISTDANDWLDQVSPEWSGAIPATLIYSRDRRQFYERSFTFDELESEVQKFIKP